MASPSASSSASSISALTSTTSPHSLSPIHHLITIKLTRDNYLLWKAQIVPYLKGNHLFGFVDGTRTPPPEFLPPTTTEPNLSLPNPDFLFWQTQDQLILSALISSLSENILAYVVKCSTSHEVWNTLERMFTAHSRARSMNIHCQLATLKKGDSSIADYFHKFTHLTDTLAAVAQPLPPHEALSFLLAGLGSDYDSLVTSVKTQVLPMSLDDLYGHMLSHELRLAQNQPTVDLSNVSANFTKNSYSTRGGRGGRHPSTYSSNRGGRSSFNPNRGRGRGRQNSSYNSNRPVCQVCHKPGHTALQCYHRFDNSYTVESHPPMQALLATPQQTPDYNWYPDSGATHHVTHDLANLNIRADEYQGSDQIRVGNGKSLPIKHIGTTQLSTPTTSFQLNNVLHVPDISNNLLSVHKFTNDTCTLMEFHPSLFRVKDLVTRRLLLQGLSKHGLYPFPPLSTKRFSSPRALLGERTSFTNWHSRLGHPAFRIVSQVISRFGLPINTTKVESACSACLSAKSKQLPFSQSSSQIKSPLDLIYFDLWGPSPVCSRSGHKYYISFLDAYSRYTWLFPISHKNDALPIFL